MRPNEVSPSSIALSHVYASEHDARENAALQVLIRLGHVV